MSDTLPRIVFENDSYWLIDKPAGWLSVPGRNRAGVNLEPQPRVLTDWLQNASDPTRRPPCFVVHRLDRFTSGIMIYAKTPQAHATANSWFLDRKVKKTYLFLASPPPQRPAIQIKTPVHGKSAQTLFEVVQCYQSPQGQPYFLGRATPITGRFHQVREHARDAGFPILGDPSTGGLRWEGIERVCLHAWELMLPFGTYRAEPPADFDRLTQ